MDALGRAAFLRVSTSSAIAFDVHISEIVIPWALGICLVSTPSARFELLSDLHSNVQRLGITHLGMVPSMIEATFTGGADEGHKLGLKYLTSGGEKISDSVRCALFSL